MFTSTVKRELKILDFDIENRPLSYWYSDRPTAEVTAIASCWVDEPRSMQVLLLGKDDPKYMLEAFQERYNEADIVTGHYIRRHDLPILNGAMLDHGLPPLGPKMTIDTKLDFMKHGDVPATQEFLAEMFGVQHEKVHVTQHEWRDANRLTRTGLQATRERCEGDVLQHMEMRIAMTNAGVLKTPKVWKP